MPRVECRHEADVLAAVSTGRWPERVDAEMRTHVEGCALCRDVIAVVAAFQTEMAQPELPDAAVHLPGSGMVWWRAQMRARQDAARLAVRPITVAQAVAFAGTVGVVGALFGATTSWFQQGVSWLGGAFSSALAVVRLGELIRFIGEHSFEVTATGLGVFVGLAAIYALLRWTEREA